MHKCSCRSMIGLGSRNSDRNWMRLTRILANRWTIDILCFPQTVPILILVIQRDKIASILYGPLSRLFQFSPF